MAIKIHIMEYGYQVYPYVQVMLLVKATYLFNHLSSFNEKFIVLQSWFKSYSLTSSEIKNIELLIRVSTLVPRLPLITGYPNIIVQ